MRNDGEKAGEKGKQSVPSKRSTAMAAVTDLTSKSQSLCETC